MSRRRTALLVQSAVLLALATGVTRADQLLIPAGSSWRYDDTGSNLGTAWRGVDFADAGWAQGPAQLGYGDGDEATIVSYGGNTGNRYITTYFRRSFSLTDPAAIATLALRYLRDDGAVIYLNGVEVVRSNMPAGTVTYTTRASSAVGGADESAWIDAPIDPALLVAGTNVVAVELHQQSPSSSDISFDLELRATEAQVSVPTVSLVAPADRSVSNASAVTFRAALSAPAGLASATLHVGGPPRTSSFSGPSQVEDAQIAAATPASPNGSGASIGIDGSPHTHGLIKFPTLIGSAGGQVPPGSLISSAVLRLNCTDPGNTIRLYRLTQDWIEGEATWNERSAGSAWASAGADGSGSNAGAAVSADCTAAGQRAIDITGFVQEWSSGAANFGLVLVDSGTNGVVFDSSESQASPALSVVYRDRLQPVETQPLSGTSSEATFSAVLQGGQTYLWNVRVADAEARQAWAAADFELTIDAGAPDEPVLVSPADGATDVAPAPALEAFVSDPAGGPLEVRAELRPAAAPEFTIIALPDTQHYSEAFPAIFSSQTQWIVNNKQARNIVFVTHEGDLVEHNNLASEWQVADTSMSLLDGVVPYGMGPGNHDQPTTLYNQVFPYTRYESQPWYGGHFQDRNDDNYQLFSGGGMDFVIVHLEFCPPAAAVAWADSVFKAHPDRIGIVTTHGYLGASAARSVHLCTNTQYLWDDLAVPNPNVRFMLSGHVHAEARRTDVVGGRSVFQMLADYQDRPSGGEGWLRILRFVPAEDKVYVQTFSPWLNRFEADADSEFSLDFPMAGSFSSVGAATVTSGSTASITPAELAAFTPYEWRVTVTNSAGRSRTGPVWRFTTGAGGAINQPPTASGQSVGTPEDSPVPLTLSGFDPDGDSLTYSVVSGPSRGSLSGTPPDLIYVPAPDFNGADSFTFRVGDGRATSSPATVSLTVGPVNDSPSAAADAYAVASGETLSVVAPGVLGNDTDVDGAGLTARLLAGPANGTLSLNANGSFSYVPASGYSGADSFSYEASDGALASTASVSLTVSPPQPPPPPTPVFTADFNSGTDGFGYYDNTFRGATQASYASGTRIATGGFTGGAVQVGLGGVNNNTIAGMSGGWGRAFTLNAPTRLRLSFRYNLDQGAEYDGDEVSQVLASIDWGLLGAAPDDYVAQVVGDGDGGPAIATGWRSFEVSVGTLPAGTHGLVIGGYNNKKNTLSERTIILIDDVSLVPEP